MGDDVNCQMDDRLCATSEEACMTGGVVAKRQLGQALRQLRDDKGMDRSEPARVLDCSESKIGKIEQGEVGVRQTEMAALLDLYDVKGQHRADLERLGQQSRQRRSRTPYGPAIPDWFRKYTSLEDAAVEVKSYDENVMPGIFQLPEYARALIMASPLRPSGDVDKLVDARMARKSRLTGDAPVKITAVIGEAALHNQVGGPDVLHHQLVHLRKLMDYPNITVRITPFVSGAHAATGFGFVLLTLSDGTLDVVYLEDLTGARYIDGDPAEQQRYGIVWNALRLAALSPEASRTLLDTLIDVP
jgi:transcriptional regulator with XRE-family HTH domain